MFNMLQEEDCDAGDISSCYDFILHLKTNSAQFASLTGGFYLYRT